jgi:hypothetical protein
MKDRLRQSPPWHPAPLSPLCAGVLAALSAVAETYMLVCSVVGLVVVTSLLLCALFWGTIRPHVITFVFGEAPCQAIWAQALIQVTEAPACRAALGPPFP